MVRMTLPLRRRLLRLAAAASLLIATAVGAPAVLRPLDGASPLAEPTTHPTEVLPARAAPADYSSVHQRNLQAPLIEVRPTPPPPPPPPKLDLTLAGTAVDPAYPCGFFRLSDGSVQSVGVGGKVGGAEVLEVTDGAATLRFAGGTVTLKVAAVEGGP